MEKLAIGILQKSHGVKGFIKFKSFSEEYKHLKKLKVVYLRKKDREIIKDVEELRSFGKQALLKFNEIDSPEEARKFSNWEVWADKKFASPKKKGEFYISELCGCEMVFNKKSFGTIKSVVEGSQGELLEVVSEKGNIVFVPFMEIYVGKVDIKSRKIQLKTEWLFE